MRHRCFRLVFTYPQKLFSILTSWANSDDGISAEVLILVRNKRQTYLISFGEAWDFLKVFNMLLTTYLASLYIY